MNRLMEVDGITEACFSSTPPDVEPHTDQEPLKKYSNGGGGGGSANGCFDCNICLDFAVDPVVTLCGHLYCWPCIYRWLQVDGPSPQQCPVCKATLSESTLVPLYGRGCSTKRTHQGTISIPRRPAIPRDQFSSPTEPQSPRTIDEDHYTDLHPPVHRRHRHQHHNLHYPYDYMSSSSSSSSLPPSPTGMRVIHSTAGGVLGGMAIAVLPWVFRNHEELSSMYYASPYYMGSNGDSPRLRRQEKEVEKLLHQIWRFLFICAVLCLLLF